MSEYPTTTPLPTSLPCPRELLQPTPPSSYDALASVLGLALEHLRAMHPTASSPPDENARASAHLLKLFIQDPVVQSLLPTDPPASHPAAEELSALQARLASVENAVTNLAANAEAPAAEEGPSYETRVALQLINVPTSYNNSSIRYTTEELHDAFKKENVRYAELDILRGPYWDPHNENGISWVPNMATVTFVFKDYPDARIAENLLQRQWLYAFGYGCEVQGMDGRGRWTLQDDASDKPEYISLRS